MRWFTKFFNRRYLLVTALLFPAALLSGLLASCGNDTGAGLFYAETDFRAGDIRSLIIIPVRREYPVDGTFNRTTDFTILLTYTTGVVEEIRSSKAEVSINEGGGAENIPLEGDTYTFTSSGEKIVTIVYGGKSAEYAVWVLSENDGYNPLNPGGGGIIIKT